MYKDSVYTYTIKCDRWYGSDLAEINSQSELEFVVELAEKKKVQLKEVSKSIGGIEVENYFVTLLKSQDGSMEQIGFSNSYQQVCKTSNIGIMFLKDLHTQNTIFSSILFKK